MIRYAAPLVSGLLAALIPVLVFLGERRRALGNLGPPGTTVSARRGEVEAAPAALTGVALLLLAQKTRPPGRASR